MMEEKSFADGWSSRLSQSVIAEVLADPDLEISLQGAAKAYEDRRRAAVSALNSRAAGLATATPGLDGVSVWVVAFASGRLFGGYRSRSGAWCPRCSR